MRRGRRGKVSLYSDDAKHEDIWDPHFPVIIVKLRNGGLLTLSMEKP